MNPYEHVAKKFNQTSGKVSKTPENAIVINYVNKDDVSITIFISPTNRSVEHELSRAIGGRTLPGSRYQSIPAKNFEQALFVASVQATCIMSALIDEGAVS